MFANSSAVKLREYERIYTGNNQDTGYQHPVLNFISDTTLQVFPVDKTTYFHYPMTAPSGTLVQSDLINCGSVASNIPFRSDRIWKKMANYRNSSIWGNSQPIGKQTGVWLCSWLSGNMVELSSTPVWMDRWYNSGYIDEATAMFIAQPTSALVVDIPSEMIFEPGCLYKYFHVGNVYNTLIINSLTGENNTHLKLHIDKWSQIPIDLSPYKNEISLMNNDSNMISRNSTNLKDKPDDNVLCMENNQYCQVVYNSCYNLSGDMSYSIWVNSDDWNNIQGSHILSKNYRGGWSLKYDSGFFNPMIFLANRSGNLLCINSDGKIIKNHTLPNISEPKAVVIDQNMFTWVLDNGIYNGAKHLYKVDCFGDIRDSINFDITENLKHLAIDSQDNLWVLATETVSGFNNYLGNLINSYVVNSAWNYLDISLSDQVSGYPNCFTFDNSGNFITMTSGEYFGYQSDDSIWVLQGSNQYLKTDLQGNLILSGNVGYSTSLSGRNIDFTKEYTNDGYQEFVWFMQEADQVLYKYDINGNLVKRVDLSQYDLNAYVLGDFTGYQRNRKFNYIENNKQPHIEADIFLNTTPLSGELYKLSIPTNLISKGWHMFTFTFNQSSINLYMDSMLRDSLTFSNQMYINYQYDNPLLIGANVGMIKSLDEELNLNQLHFKGCIDDVRIYDIALNNSDIRHLYYSKFGFKDLNWNIPTGNQSYLEEIERFFKFKLPGMKSPYYNIKLINLHITDIDTREIIENIIKMTIKKVAPAYSELYKIEWV